MRLKPHREMKFFMNVLEEVFEDFYFLNFGDELLTFTWLPWDVVA